MSRHLEVEDKYAAGDRHEVPDFTTLSMVSSVEQQNSEILRATYFDTADLALAAQHITVRRREGGPDAGWHVKLRQGQGRLEVRVPLGRATKTVPKKLRDVVAGVIRDQPMSPVATVDTNRTVHQLIDAEGVVLAELADDRVSARSLLANGDEGPHTEWREWEVELVNGGGPLLESVAGVLSAAGVKPASSESKLRRSLNLPPRAGAGPRPPSKKDARADKVLQARISMLIDEIRRLDPLVRAEAPDAVHRMRVEARRLRSALATFRPLLDSEITEPLRGELQWLGQVLGPARDAEVVRDRVLAKLSLLPAELVRGRSASWIRRELTSRHREAVRTAHDALSSERYLSLLDGLLALRSTPPWTSKARRTTKDVMLRRLRRERKRFDVRVRRASWIDETHDLASRLHDVRKGAKRLRYAAETLEPQYGADARRLVSVCTRVQAVLGDHQDSVMSQQTLLSLADQAATDGIDAFVLGVLYAEEDQFQSGTADRLAEVVRRSKRAKVRRLA